MRTLYAKQCLSSLASLRSGRYVEVTTTRTSEVTVSEESLGVDVPMFPEVMSGSPGKLDAGDDDDDVGLVVVVVASLAAGGVAVGDDVDEVAAATVVVLTAVESSSSSSSSSSSVGLTGLTRCASGKTK